MVITKPIREVWPATPRARIVRIDLEGVTFPYLAGQAVYVGIARAGSPASLLDRRCARGIGARQLAGTAVGVDADGRAGPHLDLEPGSLVDIEGPLGRFTFPPAPEERRFLFIAGGTGISPLRAMLHHALTVPHDEIGLLYSARTPSEFAYEKELRSLAASRPD